MPCARLGEAGSLWHKELLLTTTLCTPGLGENLTSLKALLAGHSSEVLRLLLRGPIPSMHPVKAIDPGRPIQCVLISLFNDDFLLSLRVLYHYEPWRQLVSGYARSCLVSTDSMTDDFVRETCNQTAGLFNRHLLRSGISMQISLPLSACTLGEVLTDLATGNYAQVCWGLRDREADLLFKAELVVLREERCEALKSALDVESGLEPCFDFF